MPRLSIVIPFVGDPQQLDDTLVSVLQNRPHDCEVLVVHRGRYDDPYQLSDEVRFIEVARRSGPLDCLNAGIVASRAPVVHLLASGVEVDAGWTVAPLRHFRQPEVAAVAAVVVDRDEPNRIISAGVGYRKEGSAWQIGGLTAKTNAEACPHDFCGPDAMAAFYRKSAVEAVGGLWARAGNTLASVDLSLAFAHSGFRSILEPRCVARVDTSAIRCLGPLRKGYYAERLFWRWASSHGPVASLAAHAALIAGQSALGCWRPSMLLQLIGRAGGALMALFSNRRASIAVPDLTHHVPIVTVVGNDKVSAAAAVDRRPSARAA